MSLTPLESSYVTSNRSRLKCDHQNTMSHANSQWEDTCTDVYVHAWIVLADLSGSKSKLFHLRKHIEQYLKLTGRTCVLQTHDPCSFSKVVLTIL